MLRWKKIPGVPILIAYLCLFFYDLFGLLAHKIMFQPCHLCHTGYIAFYIR